MRSEANRATAVGAMMRWCGLAAMAGGALLILFYAVLIVRQAIDWQAGPLSALRSIYN